MRSTVPPLRPIADWISSAGRSPPKLQSPVVHCHSVTSEVRWTAPATPVDLDVLCLSLYDLDVARHTEDIKESPRSLLKKRGVGIPGNRIGRRSQIQYPRSGRNRVAEQNPPDHDDIAPLVLH